MEPFSPDLSALVPHWSWGEAAEFAGDCVVLVALPGMVLTSLFRIRSGCRSERFAMIGLIGVLYCCFTSWLTFAASDDIWFRLRAQMFFLLLPCLAFFWLISRSGRNGTLRKRSPSLWRCFRLRSPWELLGYVLIAALVAYYLFRTVPLFDFDGDRLRLYEAAFTDKTTNMMSCAALQQDVPPDCLRFAGRKFPSHYFPHLFAAISAGPPSLSKTSYISSFWFSVPTLGIAINGLAILAFGRRALKSYASGCVALVVYALTNVTPQLKPLDITPAAALLAFIALDRFSRSGRKCWAALAVVLVGTMPCFETFHAILMLAALGLWGGVNFATALLKRRRGSQSGQSLPWHFVVVPALAGLTAFGSLQLLYLGERPVAPPKLKIDNVFGASYRATWESRAGDDDLLGRTIAVLDVWKRKPKKDEVVGPPVAWHEHAAAKAIYTVGVPIYVFCRFVHIGLFGVVHLRRVSRSRRLRPSEQIIASAALIGLTVPWIFDVGIQAGGQWWSSPNLYRPTEFGSWLLATLGCGVLVDCVTERRRWKQPATWLLGLVAGYWIVTVGGEHLGRSTQYLEVPRDQLRALAYIRQEIAYGDVVVHPWSDCVIYDAAKHDATGGDAVAFVYKRHFTLGSNLAGRTMYYEGREDYTFSNGFISPEEVYRRSELRRKFYYNPRGTMQKGLRTIDDLDETEGTRVQYVVEDEWHEAPSSVGDKWPVVFRSGEVTIRRRP